MPVASQQYVQKRAKMDQVLTRQPNTTAQSHITAFLSSVGRLFSLLAERPQPRTTQSKLSRTVHSKGNDSSEKLVLSAASG